jgi:hypothetical protein
MRSHRDLWKRAQRSLTGEALGRTVAGLVLAEVDRMDMGRPPVWTNSELEALKRPLVRDSRARCAYIQCITDGCQARGIEPPPLEVLDPPDEIQLSMSVRWFLLDHAETDIPASTPEEAYQAFTAWQPMHGGYTMALDAFTKHFLEERRLLKGHLKGCHPVYGPAGQILAPAAVDP